MLFSLPISRTSQLHLTFTFTEKWYTFTCLLSGASVHTCHLTQSLKAIFSPALSFSRYTIRTSHWWHPPLRRFLWHTNYTIPQLQLSSWKRFGKCWTAPVFSVQIQLLGFLVPILWKQAQHVLDIFTFCRQHFLIYTVLGSVTSKQARLEWDSLCERF